MFFKQFKVEGLGCLSYLIGCPQSKQAFVIDPKRDFEDYIIEAEKNGMKITGIIDTHVHADHISGACELSKITGATIYTGNDPEIKYSHKVLKENDELFIGSIKLKIIETPGHTPYSISILLTDLKRSSLPCMLFTGDLLFVGSIGRPDLAGNEILDEQIKNLYKSLHEKVLKLPEYIEIYPAHGEGSLCGKGLSSKLSSTIGYEKNSNPILKLDFEQFKSEILKTVPFRPKNFSHIIKTNKKGPIPISQLPKLKNFYVDEIKKFKENGGILIDLRDPTCFGSAHIPESINIGLSDKSATWLGTIVDPKNELLLIADNLNDVEIAVKNFRRAGYDKIVGYTIGINSWILNGEDTGFLPQISVHSLKHVLEKYDNHHVIDVRDDDEWNSGHIKGAIHIPLQKFFEKDIDIPFKEHISVICGSGYRSNIAGSILKAKGYKNVYSVIGGMNTWIKKYPVE